MRDGRKCRSQCAKCDSFQFNARGLHGAHPPDTMCIKTMRRRDLLRTCAAAPLALAAGRRAFGQNRYQPTWESIDQRPSPAWYTDSKFGIFIHWGVYSVPSYRPRQVQGRNHVRRVVLELAQQDRTPVHPQIPRPQLRRQLPLLRFRPHVPRRTLQSRPLGRRLQRSGAKYVALTSKHHEGFTPLAQRAGQQHLGTSLERRRHRPQTRFAARPDGCRPPARPPHGHLLLALRVVQPALALRQETLRRRAHVPAVQGRGHAPQAEHHFLRRRMGADQRRMALTRAAGMALQRIAGEATK